MFESGRTSVLDTRRSGAKLGRSSRMLTSERTTSLTTESDPIQQPVQNRERLLIQGGQGAGGSASDQLLQNKQFQLHYQQNKPQLQNPPASVGSVATGSLSSQNPKNRQISHGMLEDGVMACTIVNGKSSEQSVINTGGDTSRAAILARRAQLDGKNPSENNVTVMRQLNAGQAEQQNQPPQQQYFRKSQTEVATMMTDSQNQAETEQNNDTQTIEVSPAHQQSASRRNTIQKLRVVQQTQLWSKPQSPNHERRRSSSFNWPGDDVSSQGCYAPNDRSANCKSGNVPSRNQSASKQRSSKNSEEGFLMRKSQADLPGVQLLRNSNINRISNSSNFGRATMQHTPSKKNRNKSTRSHQESVNDGDTNSSGSAEPM